jgi:DNA-directed RNA polymerase subunit RPC12/RpoP
MRTDTHQSILTSGSTAVVVETGPVICQRCRKPFAHFALEEIKGITQLRCGDLLITKTEANCLHCGWTFHWSIREKDVERMAQVYGRLVVPYIAE